MHRHRHPGWFSILRKKTFVCVLLFLNHMFVGMHFWFVGPSTCIRTYKTKRLKSPWTPSWRGVLFLNHMFVGVTPYMYVCMYVCMYVGVHAWFLGPSFGVCMGSLKTVSLLYICVCMRACCDMCCVFPWMCICMYVCMYVSMCEALEADVRHKWSMYVSIYVCIYLCMYLSIHLSIYLSIYLQGADVR